MKYFIYSEFDSPDEPGSGIKMNKHFLNLLDKIRKDAGFPFVISSGYRTEVHNKAVGGTDNSAHLRGLAADIKVGSSRQRFDLIASALNHNINRIGIGKGFVHLDSDGSLPVGVIWLY